MAEYFGKKKGQAQIFVRFYNNDLSGKVKEKN